MSDHSPLITLTGCPLFEAMSPDDLDAVFGLMQSEEFPAGNTILVEGRTHSSLWVIISGRCEVVKGPCSGQSNRLAVLETGAIFGEMSFLETAPHSASIRALTDVGTMRLTRDGYEQLRNECPAAACSIARSLILVLSARLRRMDEWTCGLVQKNGNEKQHAEWHEFRAKLYGGLQF